MPKAELSADGTRIEIAAGYHERHLAQSIPGASYRNNTWSVAASWAACVMLRGVFGRALELGPRLTAWAYQLRQDRLDPAAALRDVLHLPPGHEDIEKLIDEIEKGHSE